VKEITRRDSPLPDHTDSSGPSSVGAGDQNKENQNLSFVTASPTVKTLHSGKESEKGKKSKPQLYNKLNHVKIPKFYHPYGKPATNQNKGECLHNAVQEIGKLDEEKAFKQHMKTVTKVRLFYP
jgi:hypothetical protein